MLHCSALADWYGWTAGAMGLTSGLLLARPLFLLLRQREGLEALGRALDSGEAGELADAYRVAQKNLSAQAYAGRNDWKRWAYPGVALLMASIIPTMLQFACLL